MGDCEFVHARSLSGELGVKGWGIYIYVRRGLAPVGVRSRGQHDRDRRGRIVSSINCPVVEAAILQYLRLLRAMLGLKGGRVLQHA